MIGITGRAAAAWRARAGSARPGTRRRRDRGRLPGTASAQVVPGAKYWRSSPLAFIVRTGAATGWLSQT